MDYYTQQVEEALAETRSILSMAGLYHPLVLQAVPGKDSASHPFEKVKGWYLTGLPGMLRFTFILDLPEGPAIAFLYPQTSHSQMSVGELPLDRAGYRYRQFHRAGEALAEGARRKVVQDFVLYLEPLEALTFYSLNPTLLVKSAKLLYWQVVEECVRPESPFSPVVDSTFTNLVAGVEEEFAITAPDLLEATWPEETGT